MEANRLQVTKTELEMQRMEIEAEWQSVKYLNGKENVILLLQSFNE